MARPSDYTPELAAPAYIYGLYDADGNLRYIGKANCVKSRFAGHMRDVRKKKTPLYNWIRKHGEPEVRVLEVCTQDTWEEAEVRLIREGREKGLKILNVADGGNQPFCPVEVRRKNGMRNIRKMTGVEPYTDEEVSREALIISTYNWLYNFGRTRGLDRIADKAKAKMKARYEEDPVTYKCWANA